MGFFGEDFFQNDRDLDVLSTLTERMDTKDDLFMPENPIRLRNELDSGKLDAEFRNLRDGNFDSQSDLGFWGAKTAIVILAAAAMRHGATLSEEYRQYVKTATKSRLGMYNTAKSKIAEAVVRYQNGVPLDLAGKCLEEVATELDTRESTPNSHGYIGLNLLDPTFFAGVETAEDECDACRKQNDSLLHCGRCRKARYCNAECQKKAWKKHKEVCRPA